MGFISKTVLIASVALTGIGVKALARRANMHGVATLSRWISLMPLFGLLLALPLFILWFASAVWMVVWGAAALKRTAIEAVAIWAADTKHS